MINTAADNFITDVYRKPIHTGKCTNGTGECTKSYKTGVIKAYVRKTLSTCFTCRSLHQEVRRVRHILDNSEYSDKDIDNVISKMLDHHFSGHDAPRYPQQEDKKIRLVVYYKNPRISSHVIKNNITGNSEMLAGTNVEENIIISGTVSPVI